MTRDRAGTQPDFPVAPNDLNRGSDASFSPPGGKYVAHRVRKMVPCGPRSPPGSDAGGGRGV